MQRIQDRLYYLLTLDLRTLSKEFMVVYIYLFIYIVLSVIIRTRVNNLLIGILTLTLVGLVHLTLFLNHLTVIVSEVKISTEVEADTVVFEKEVRDEVMSFSFEDNIEKMFNDKDALGLTEVLFNRNETKIKEVIK